MDVYETCRGFRQRFEEQGFQVRMAMDERSGIDYAPFVNPDVILIELGLSPLDSLTVGANVREYAPHYSDVLVVVLANTANDMVSEGGEVALGNNVHIILPDDFAQLQRYMARLLRQSNTHKPVPRSDGAVKLPPPIMVVDDADDVRDMLVVLLTRRGYQVLEARDGQEAVEIASGKCPGLILMDLNMPVLDGYGAVQRMRALAELCNVPIIAVSANNEAECRTKALNIGFNEYLTKPIDFVQLESLLQQFLKAA